MMITRRIGTISAAILALTALAACVPVPGDGVYGDPYLGGGDVYRTDDGRVFSTLLERDTYLRRQAERRRAADAYGRVPTDRELRRLRRRERERARAEERRHQEAADQRERRRLAEIRRHEREQAHEEHRRRQVLRDREEQRLRREARNHDRAREERRLRREQRDRAQARAERRQRREARDRARARDERRAQRDRGRAVEEHPVPQNPPYPASVPNAHDGWTPVYRDGQLMYMDEEGRLHSP